MFRSISRLALLLFFYPVFLTAQQNYIVDIQQYTADQGLSHNHIYQTFQDRRGLIWLLTGNGLNRFDGQQFKNVMATLVSDQPKNNEICFEDQEGYLWIKDWKEGGLPKFRLIHTISGEITTPERKYGKAFPHNVYHVAPGKKGSIWVCTHKGELLNFEPKQSRVAHFHKFSRPFSFWKVDTLRNLIWQDFIETKWNENRIVSLVDFNGKTIFTTSVKLFQYSYFDNKGVFCFSTLSDFHFISPEGKTWSMPIQRIIPHYVPKMSNHFGIPLGYDPVLGFTWILYDNALYVFSIEKGIQYVIDNEITVKRPTTGYSILLDKQGLAWVSSIDGLYKISIKPPRFQKLMWKNSLETDNPNEFSCRGIYKDEQTGTLYVNAAKCFWSIQGKAIQKNIRREQAFFALAPDGQGGIWLGCESLYRFNKETKTASFLTDMPPGSSLIWSFYQTKDRLWLGTNVGLAYYDQKTGKVSFVGPQKSDPVLENAIIHAIEPAVNGQMWLLTEKGLFLFDPPKGILEH
jgi:ligand-binding sensor domain-containing protein